MKVLEINRLTLYEVILYQYGFEPNYFYKKIVKRKKTYI